MVGSGIASSLIHEVGHQAASLLGLAESLRPVLKEIGEANSGEAAVWRLWERWISEIVADFWSVARVGVVSTIGLMGVVSLPRAFVFRVNPDDPHPAPWIRVQLSAAMGDALHPQPAWRRLSETWESWYPLDAAAQEQSGLLAQLKHSIPELVRVLMDHRPPALRGASLREAMDLDELQPARLRALLQRWRSEPWEMYQARPIAVFAAIGQARADASITPEEESVVIGKLLTHWALRSTLQEAAACARRLPAEERSGLRGA
jgi:hypothetical protein